MVSVQRYTLKTTTHQDQARATWLQPKSASRLTIRHGHGSKEGIKGSLWLFTQLNLTKSSIYGVCSKTQTLTPAASSYMVAQPLSPRHKAHMAVQGVLGARNGAALGMQLTPYNGSGPSPSSPHASPTKHYLSQHPSYTSRAGKLRKHCRKKCWRALFEPNGPANVCNG
jgi:hypothetical protein